MKGYYIEVTNNLLEKKHRKAMGTAVWEFMWFLDKITRIDDDGVGWVLGGKPINLDDIVAELGIHPVNVSKNLTKLEKAGYIHIIHAPYGMSVRVAKAKKRFSSKDKKSFSDNAKPLPKTISENAKPNIRQDSINDNTVLLAAGAAPEKEKLELLRETVEHYKLVKGFDRVAGWDKANFPMNSKYAKQYERTSKM